MNNDKLYITLCQCMTIINDYPKKNKIKKITRAKLVAKATRGLPFDSYGGHRHVKHIKCVTVMSVLNVYRR